MAGLPLSQRLRRADGWAESRRSINVLTAVGALPRLQFAYDVAMKNTASHRLFGAPTKASRADVTIKDIAAHLGLSHATVSRALNDHATTNIETKRRVHEAADELGYVRNTNASALSGAASRLVGFIVPDVKNEFYSTVAKVIADRCARAGLQMVLAISEDDPKLEHQHVLALRQARAAGVVITPTAGLIERTRDLLQPVAAVQLVRTHPLLEGSRVGMDDCDGVRLATEHLLELGHKRIGFIGGFEALTTGRARRQGYEEALAAADVAFDDSIALLGPPRSTFGGEAIRKLVEEARDISAVVVAGPQLMLGALSHIQELGLQIPRDLSIVGYGDSEWFSIWGPGLTTITLPIAGIGAAAAEALFNALESLPEKQRVDTIFKARLTKRGSTARFDPRRKRP